MISIEYIRTIIDHSNFCFHEQIREGNVTNNYDTFGPVLRKTLQPHLDKMQLEIHAVRTDHHYSLKIPKGMETIYIDPTISQFLKDSPNEIFI